MKGNEKVRSENSKSSDDEDKNYPDFSMIFEGTQNLSPYRFRKDVRFKFILRKFKNYYKDEFISATNYLRENKNKEERRENLKQCAVEYCTMKGFTDISMEFPFYFTALIFPKDTEEIVKHMTKTASSDDMVLLKKVLKVISLLKGIIKSYSETRMKKVTSIFEIRMLLKGFLNEVSNQANQVEFISQSSEQTSLSCQIYKELELYCNNIFIESKLYQNQTDKSFERKYIKSIIDSFKRLIGFSN